jgi:hypothetical protein
MKERKKFKKSHQKLTCVGVEPTTLCFRDHHSTILTTIFPYYISNFFKINLNYARSHFLITLFCKCSFDIQQKDICIKPWSIEFEV